VSHCYSDWHHVAWQCASARCSPPTLHAIVVRKVQPIWCSDDMAHPSQYSNRPADPMCCILHCASYARRGALASALQSPSSSLRSVTLSGNPGITDSVVSQLAASLQGSTQKVIDPGSVSGLELDLSTTGVSSACLSALSEVSRLTKLSLLGCQLGDSGAGLLAQLMSSGSGFGRLQELVVSGCGVGEAGGQALLAAISEGHPPVLVSIELGGNPVCGEESFHEKVQACRELRPEVGIHWRGGAGDQQQ
jgi:hypothetical protein